MNKKIKAVAVMAATVVLMGILLGVVINHTIIPGHAFSQSEELMPTIGIQWWGPKYHETYYSPLPDGLEFITNKGRTITAGEMVQVINPELNPVVREGKVYLVEPAYTAWGWHIKWLSPNPVTTFAGRLMD